MASETNNEPLLQMIKRVLQEENPSWGKHVNHSCGKCKDCTCGKHKCLIKAPHVCAPTPQTVYSKEYCKKRTASQSQNHCKIEKQFNTYKPEMIIPGTSYQADFMGKNRDQGPNPEVHKCNLTTGGPSFSTTTYQNNFVSPKSTPADMIKNGEWLGCIPGARLRSSSNYKETYKWYEKEQIHKQNPIRKSDNLKTQVGFFTPQSNYSLNYPKFTNYKKDNTNFAPRRSYQNTKGIITETSYNKDFSYKQPEQCPATVY